MHCETVNRATKEYPFLIEHIDVRYIPHFHEETELVFVLDGAINVTIENNSFILNKNEICIITPNIIHNLYTEKSSKTFVMKLFPATDISNLRLSDAIVRPNSEIYEPLKKCISEIMNENENKLMGHELAVSINSEKILLMIIRNTNHEALESTSQFKHNLKNKFLCTVTLFLEDHYSENFSLDDISARFNYTKSYFCHCFKRITGVTFWKYYTIFRLEKSIELMKQFPEMKCIEISENSGFNNLRSFNEAFRKYYNCTPVKYKKKYCSFD